jgi:hypothetical protein
MPLFDKSSKGAKLVVVLFLYLICINKISRKGAFSTKAQKALSL